MAPLLDQTAMSDEQRLVYLRGKVVAICEAILREEMQAIPGSRILNKLEMQLLHHRTFGWFERDEDFLPFVAIDSETDDLPVDLERHNWSAEALQRKDQEILKAEQWAKEIAFPACTKLIERFRIVTD